jgi:FkbM family methyltransferase
MHDDSKLALRPASWDGLIVENVLRGEYGPIDVRDALVVDVGAHIGAFAILAARQGARRVLAYEPDAENFRLLTINASRHPAIEPRRAAVWRSDRDERSLAWRASTNPRNTGGGTVLDAASIAGVAVDRATAQDVDAVSLDGIVAASGEIGLLKIDAEGSEYPILATSRRLDRVAAIVGEIHAVEGVDASMHVPGVDAWTPDALLDLLEARGFEVATRRTGADVVFRARRR